MPSYIQKPLSNNKKLKTTFFDVALINFHTEPTLIMKIKFDDKFQLKVLICLMVSRSCRYFK